MLSSMGGEINPCEIWLHVRWETPEEWPIQNNISVFEHVYWRHVIRDFLETSTTWKKISNKNLGEIHGFVRNHKILAVTSIVKWKAEVLLLFFFNQFPNIATKPHNADVKIKHYRHEREDPPITKNKISFSIIHTSPFPDRGPEEIRCLGLGMRRPFLRRRVTGNGQMPVGTSL